MYVYILVVTLAICLLQACDESSSSPTTHPIATVRKINPLLRELNYQADSINSSNEFSIVIGSNDVSMLIDFKVNDGDNSDSGDDSDDGDDSDSGNDSDDGDDSDSGDDSDDGDDSDSGVVITEIIDPDGKAIYTASIKDGEVEFNSDFYHTALRGDESLIAFLPTTPPLKLTAGVYRFKMQKIGQAKLNQARVFIKSNPANGDIDLTDLEVDLNVLITDKDSEYRSQVFQNRLRTSYRKSINNMLSPHRIMLDKVNIYLSTDAESSAFGIIDHENEDDTFSSACQALARYSSSDKNMALNLVFAEGFKGNAVAGVSPEPGIILDKASHGTCFAVARSAYSSLPKFYELPMQAGNILHEAMHFLSLPHPTESDGEVFDKIADTPECSAAIYDGRNNSAFKVAGKKDGEVSDHECSYEGGADNVLFHGGHPDFLPFHITSDQAWVLKRHPLVRLSD